jgi:hypothetical protein
MALPRYFGLVDLGVVTVVAVALFLPPREMFAQNAFKGDEFAIALAEARTMARPTDGVAIEDFTRKLGEADMKDWAIESSVRLAERAKESPTRWRALIAVSVAYIEKVDVNPALDYANRALAACEAAREKGDQAACPSWEEVRMRLYQQHLDAGVKSGIDPRVNPRGFREAGEKALHYIRIAPPHGGASSSDTPAGSAGSDTGKTGP